MTDEPAAQQEAVEPPKDRPHEDLPYELIIAGQYADDVGDWLQHSATVTMVEAAASLACLNFAVGFFQTLGKHAADGAAKLPKRATDLLRKVVQRDGKPDEVYIGLEDSASAVIIFTEGLPDEARLALLDLDVTAPELRGKELRWDEKTMAWRPSDAAAAELGDATDH